MCSPRKSTRELLCSLAVAMLGLDCPARLRPSLDVRYQGGLQRNPQQRPALGLTRAGLSGNLNLKSTARFADAQVAPVLRLRAHRRRLPTVPEARACAACTPRVKRHR